MKTFDLPKVDGGGNAYKGDHSFLIGDWAEFLGWYLSEGSTWVDLGKGKYSIKISQSKEVNPENWERIAACLDALDVTWSYSEKTQDFSISRKQLACYLRQFGRSQYKWIPRELLEAPVSARRRLLSALLAGDGRVNKTHTAYTTTSLRLARDVQFLALSLGYSTNFLVEEDAREERYLDVYVISLHKRKERCALKSTRAQLRRRDEVHYSRQEYDGTVYCATVPGGLLYTRRGNGVGRDCQQAHPS